MNAELKMALVACRAEVCHPCGTKKIPNSNFEIRAFFSKGVQPTLAMRRGPRIGHDPYRRLSGFLPAQE